MLDDRFENRSFKTGFTIVELMVVISIMVLLLGLVVPSFSRARLASKKAVCLSNLRSIGQAIESYLGDFHDTFPHVAQLPSIEPVVADAEGREPRLPLPEVLAQQVSRSEMVFRCPADKVVVDAQYRDLHNTETFFDVEKTSYEWNTFFNGIRRRQKILKKETADLLSDWIKFDLANTPLVQDFEPFHGGPDAKGSHQVLYGDLHVQADS